MLRAAIAPNFFFWYPDSLSQFLSSPSWLSPLSYPTAQINGIAEGAAGESSTDDDVTSPLGPLLPYHEDDEELLLDVMIARQTGTGLGFKLTPAYLLQMCIAFCSVKQGPASLERLLTKIAREIHKVVSSNPSNPDMLLFWASNTLKLMGSLLKDSGVFGESFGG